MNDSALSSPDISVILPVRNGAAWLPDAIRSVLEQSHDNFELLIFDDGSTDESPMVAREFGSIDERVRVFVRPHRGLVATLNELIGCAHAPFLARMDADDVCLPDRFANQLAFLRAHPRVAAVGGSVLFIDAMGDELGRGAALLDHDAIVSAAWGGRSAICHSAAMFRTEHVFAVGGYRRYAYPAEELDLVLRLSEVATLANLPDDVLALRQHGDSITATVGDAAISDARRVCLEAAALRTGCEAPAPAFDAHEPAAFAAREPVHAAATRGRIATHRGGPRGVHAAAG
jgi:glycosyltransferase involved in cell wall biosynthesis